MIYFDNASTTETIYNTEPQFNPSSVHKGGIDSARHLHDAKKFLIEFTGLTNHNVYITSGGTEANNIAILGFYAANKRTNIKYQSLLWEHPSISEPMRFLSESADVNISIEPEITDNTFISISQVCSETGDVYDLKKLSDKLKKHNNAILHVDGAQGFAKYPVPEFADIYTISGHKIHAPVGIGAIFIRKSVKIKPIMFGGSQENGFRPGTENLGGLLAMNKAAANYSHSNVAEIKDYLSNLSRELDNAYIISMGEKVSDHILTMNFTGIKGEVLANLLSEKGLYVSTGSACRSSKKEKNSLFLMGYDKETADSSIRLSFSYTNTMEEAIKAKEIIKEAINTLRRV